MNLKERFLDWLTQEKSWTVIYENGERFRKERKEQAILHANDRCMSVKGLGMTVSDKRRVVQIWPTYKLK